MDFRSDPLVHLKFFYSNMKHCSYFLSLNVLKCVQCVASNLHIASITFFGEEQLRFRGKSKSQIANHPLSVSVSTRQTNPQHFHKRYEVLAPHWPPPRQTRQCLESGEGSRILAPGLGWANQRRLATLARPDTQHCQLGQP